MSVARLFCIATWSELFFNNSDSSLDSVMLGTTHAREENVPHTGADNHLLP